MPALRLVSIVRLALFCAFVMTAGLVDAQSSSTGQTQEDAYQGPVRLRQPSDPSLRDEGVTGDERDTTDRRADRRDSTGDSLDNTARQQRDGRTQRDGLQTERRDSDRDRERDFDGLLPPRPLDAFELYVRRSGALGVRRFGTELVTGTPRELMDGNALVPPDYIVAPGDELLVTLWGSVDANLRLLVDRAGRITIPRVGAVMVAGSRFADLPGIVSQRVSQVFRNFQVSVSLGRLRNIRIYVTGYVQRPGAYTVGGLSTIVAAVMRAGGPSAAGSFRRLELRRGKDLVTTFDLYDLLIKGDKTADRVLQAEDVVHVGPVGPQVALVGSVNKPAIFELKPADSYDDVLQMAGGFNAVADRSRMAVEGLADRQSQRITQLALPDAAKLQPVNGDLVRVFSMVESTLPVARQNKRIKVEGEVFHPGEYVLPPESSISDALKAAGGLTLTAYVFGTEFNRETVRRTQQENYDRALRDMETEFARAQSTQRALNADEAATFEARNTATQRLMARLRAVKPNGRVVLQLQSESRELPNLALEDGDAIYIPPRPTTVGVFGSVFNAGSYLYSNNSSIDDYLHEAGGSTRGGDPKSTFVLRANGGVVSNQQKTTFLGFGGGVGNLPALPGDTVFVPEEMNKTTWVQNLREWTQIFYQFGLGAAALQVLKN